MTRPWLAPLLTAALALACAVAVLTTEPQPPRHGAPVCEYAATSGPHGPGVMTCTIREQENRP